MENIKTEQKIKELLSGDDVIKTVMSDLNWIINDDMMTGAILVCEMELPGTNVKVQLQVRLTIREQQYFENHRNEKPKFTINRGLDLSI